MLTLLHGDALTKLAEIDSESVQCVVTSPPYWGLRDYGVDGQLGLEKTPEEYVAALVEIFREVKRVLRSDGTCWLNLGDSYATDPKGPGGASTSTLANGADRYHLTGMTQGRWRDSGLNLKRKDLVGIPWMVAFALRADGWYLRSDIIWSKPNPMPESVTDRPTKAHEYIFLLTKSERYFFDQDAVREPHAEASLPRAMRGVSENNKWVEGAPGSTAHTMSKPRPNIKHSSGTQAGAGSSFRNGHSGYYGPDGRLLVNPNGRNVRTVWTVSTEAYPDAHFATFPTAIPTRCILAGSKAGDTVLDPFAGSGTTGKVAIELGRRAILIEPKDEYVEMIERRCRTTIGLPFGGEASELEMISE